MTITINISAEQLSAFKHKEQDYKSHIPYAHNTGNNYCTSADRYTTSSFSKIYSAVRDYYNSREW